jgi:membrane-associated phospholipid phosphatase
MLIARPKILLGTTVAAVGVFAVVGIVANWTSWDQRIIDVVERHYDESRNDVLNLLLDASMALGAVFALAVGIVLVVRRRRLHAFFWILAVTGVLVLDIVLKEIFQRPSIGVKQDEYSFPSGNAMASVAVVVGLFLITRSSERRRWILALGIPAIVVYGALLVFLLWHYPSDVVAGWFAALAWVAGIAFVLRRGGGPGDRPPASTVHG